GQTYLGSLVTGNTDASGDVGFIFSSPITFAAGEFITATATDSNGNTSEFSACFTATAPASSDPSGVGAANPSTVAQGGTTELTVTVTPGTNPTSTNLMV